MFPIRGTGTGALIVPAPSSNDVSVADRFANFELLHCLNKLPGSALFPTCVGAEAGGGEMTMLGLVTANSGPAVDSSRRATCCA
jgi:hypothetical protein